MRHSLKLISGLGDKRIEILNSIGVHTVEDLVKYIPRKYLDRTVVSNLSEVASDKEYTAIVIVKSTRIVPGRVKRLLCRVYDETDEIEVVFFNAAQYMQNKFQEGTRLVVSGSLTDDFKKSMVHPDVMVLESDEEYHGEIVPIYPMTEDMKRARVEQKFLKKIIAQAFTLPTLKDCDTYPSYIQDHYSFEDELVNLKRLHNPKTMAEVYQGMRQLKLQELLPFTCRLSQRRELLKQHGTTRVKNVERSLALQKLLPFTLTESQQSALSEIHIGLAAPSQYHALIQGDVGSGKTVVAFCAAADVIENGYQVAILAPTEILAWQHYCAARELFASLQGRVALLTGSTQTAERLETLSALASGSIDIIIGTHALFSKDVQYCNLGMVVVDEQHRFGVEQRARLLQKGDHPDLLAMSATPIPRSLTMALYGDMVSVIIGQKPAGRKEILTRVVPEYKRDGMKTFIQKEIGNGGQVYWVVPRIESQEGQSLRSVDDLFEELSNYFVEPVAYLHGKTDEEYKRTTLDAFNAGQVKVLVSTTVIEVGVNVPAATIMVIEGADRFGLAQLHQLRGRVGRGSAGSWCFLLSESENRERLDAFAKTANGFEIAEMDLRDRGSGNIEAYDQSGAKAFKYFDFIDDFELIEECALFSDSILHKLKEKNIDDDHLVRQWLDHDRSITQVIA